MAEPVPTRHRRVLIALDSAARCEVLLDTAARLAGHLRAELEALFVEDADLVRLAGLPFVREVGRQGTPRGLDPDQMQRVLADHAAEVERLLGESARRAQLQWRFQIARGRLLQELLSASAEGDLVLLARRGLQPVEAMRRARLAVAAPVLVVWQDSPAGRHALAAAADIAELESRPLLVLVAASGPSAAARLWQAVRSALGDFRGVAAYRQLPDLGPATLAEAARIEGADRLVQALPSSAEELEMLSSRLPCPLVLVR